MILIAYDRGASAERAISVAASLLRVRRAHVIHVWEPLTAPTDVYGVIAARLGAVDDVADALEDAVDRLAPDLIVVGSHARTGFKALLEGSVAHHVSAHAHAPVLIVPRPRRGRDSPRQVAADEQPGAPARTRRGAPGPPPLGERHVARHVGLDGDHAAHGVASSAGGSKSMPQCAA
jgi:Universal stress protein family